MTLRHLSLLILVPILLLSACGKDQPPPPSKTTAGKTTSPPKPADQVRPEDLPDDPPDQGIDSLPVVDDETEMPKAKGGAADYEDLGNYLPEPDGDFEPVGNPGGSRLEIAGHSVSTASQEWRGGGSKLRITLNDCGRNPEAYSAVMQKLTPKGSAESFADDRGVSVYSGGTTHVVLGARGRYILEMEATGGGDRSEELQALAEEAAAGLP